MIKSLYDKKGISPLISILIIGASALVIAYNSVPIGQSTMDMEFNAEKGKAALFLADSCVKETINKLKADNDYLPNNYLLALYGGNCNITVVQNGADREISIESNYEKYYKQILLKLTLDGKNATIYEWREY